MIEVAPVGVGNFIGIGVSMQLPRTKVMTISTDNGYIMCGLVDLARLDAMHPERRIAAARVSNVKIIEELLSGIVDAMTEEARRRGVVEGMTGLEALEKLK